MRGWLTALFCALALSGCQTGAMNSQSVMDVKPEANPEVAAAASAQVEPLRVGQGPNLVVMRFSQDGALNAKEVQNGALLAIDELSDGQITLAIASGNQIVTGSENAVLVVQSGTGSVSSGKAPVISLVGNDASRGGAFAFIPNHQDSVAAGLRYFLQQAGPSQTAVLLAGPTASEQKIQSILASVGGDVKVVRYKPTDSASAIAANIIKIAANPAAIAFLGDTPLVPDIANAL
ncbi:MAG: hypothetical protein ACRCT6_12235, partial [Notoacmeibacter sp.]